MRSTNLLYIFPILIAIAFSGCRRQVASHTEIPEDMVVKRYTAIVPDIASYEMVIEPDTLPVGITRIPVTLLNHRNDTAYSGQMHPPERYNEITASWERVVKLLPPGVKEVETYPLYIIPPHGRTELYWATPEDKPGRYRFIMAIEKPRANTVIGEFVLSMDVELKKEHEYLREYLKDGN